MCQGLWRTGRRGAEGRKHMAGCVLKNVLSDRNRLLEKYAFPALSVMNSSQMLTLRLILIYYKGFV